MIMMLLGSICPVFLMFAFIFRRIMALYGEARAMTNPMTRFDACWFVHSVQFMGHDMLFSTDYTTIPAFQDTYSSFKRSFGAGQ
jgi:hypothetical protein